LTSFSDDVPVQLIGPLAGKHVCDLFHVLVSTTRQTLR
jgi:hypothetical protein